MDIEGTPCPTLKHELFLLQLWMLKTSRYSRAHTRFETAAASLSQTAEFSKHAFEYISHPVYAANLDPTPTPYHDTRTKSISL